MNSRPTVDNADGDPADEALSGIVHDLRNSLYAMKLGLQALRSADKNEENIEIWNIIDEEHSKSVRLFDELASAARTRRNSADRDDC
jgi:signal transduction histidine kinase